MIQRATLSTCFLPPRRELENLLNSAWSTLAVPGEWLSFDEQMVKSTARAMTSLLRYNPAKPIKHGKLNFARVRAHANLWGPIVCRSMQLSL